MNKRDRLIAELKNFFLANSGQYMVETAFLYGSWARGWPRLDSDVDVAVRFAAGPRSEDDFFQIIADMTLALTEKLRVEVNVAPLYADFQKPMLYYNAVVLGVPIFFEDFSKYADLRNEAIFQMEDFSIFGTGWQLSAAGNNLKRLKRLRSA